MATRKKETVLEEAERLVGGQRQVDYGPPSENFQRIAELWTAYLGHPEVTLSTTDVANLMILLKVSRIRTGGLTRDSVVDVAGYTRLLELLSVTS